MDAHRIEVLDRADDDAVTRRVAHDLELVLLPAVEEAFDDDLSDRARAQPGGDLPLELRAVTRDPSAGSAERERRPDDRRQRPIRRNLLQLRDGHALRHRQAGGQHRLAETEPVLSATDRGDVGADQLDPEPVERARLVELDGQVECGLPAERREQRVGSLGLDHLEHRLRVERLEIRRVRPLRVGHDRRRVRVRQDDAVALAAEHAAGLRSRVVELAGLADPDRPRADDQDRAKIGALRHVSAMRSKKGRASSGPGAASGWN